MISRLSSRQEFGKPLFRNHEYRVPYFAPTLTKAVAQLSMLGADTAKGLVAQIARIGPHAG